MRNKDTIEKMKQTAREQGMVLKEISTFCLMCPDCTKVKQVASTAVKGWGTGNPVESLVSTKIREGLKEADLLCKCKFFAKTSKYRNVE